ncbi:MAG TPA: 50S ribosomal protein L9 [Thermoleophilaceae bacterium]|nr:50S ribosomal protein L9 [Thermoleophilaceae bacterium]
MAQAILLQDVEALGERGDVIDVSSGYLRNYLAPRKLAEIATPGAMAAAKQRIETAEREAREKVERAEENAALLRKTVLTISQQSGDDGRLFGSVTSQEIAKAIKQARGIKVDKRNIFIDEPIKFTGTHMVRVEVNDGVFADVKTIVVGQQ